MQTVSPSYRPPGPTTEDPADSRARRADLHVTRNHDIGAAAAALKAPSCARPAAPGQITATFRALNPQVGDDAPTVPPNPFTFAQGGGDSEANFRAQAERRQGRQGEMGLGSLFRTVEPRRGLNRQMTFFL